MKRALLLGVAVCIGFGLLLSTGCAQKAASVSEAIQNSQAMKTAQEKANYLISQAKAFYNSKQFQSAVDLGQYVLNRIDANSQQAKDLIAKAKEQLQAAAQKAAGNMNKLLGK